ncbi:hypothetical protein [Rhizomonospora bruguierae]|uniref:hypothetical protein n=1 Tax=Rhizomonospora bruguierae TaxID=1581705 RepID=UPI001BCB033B|nr:hypothetical protein [Micromonospora sp. NBRC 107566]
MRRLFAPIGATVLVLLAAACAGEYDGPHAVPPTAGAEALFGMRAAQLAEGWRAAPGAARWRTGFVPLQDLTVVSGDAGFTDETKQAFMAGWYRSEAPLPGNGGGHGAIVFADGQRMEVPLVGAAEAYGVLDQGDPPPCHPTAGSPPPAGAGPDGTTSTTSPQVCTALTVTGVRLGTVPLRTSRGEATVPAYLFTVRELKAPVARVAVAPSAIAEAPAASMPAEQSPSWLRSASGLSHIDGATLEYLLGLGACDVDVKPLFVEYDDAVVVGGTARTEGDVCTDQLVIKTVTVTLAKPLGDRVVLDAGTGQPLSLTPALSAQRGLPPTNPPTAD